MGKSIFITLTRSASEWGRGRRQLLMCSHVWRPLIYSLVVYFMCGRTCPQPTLSMIQPHYSISYSSERKCSMTATLPIRRTHLRYNTIHFKYHLIIHGMWHRLYGRTMTMWRVAKFSSGSSWCSSFTENYYLLLVWMMAMNDGKQRHELNSGKWAIWRVTNSVRTSRH